MYLTFQYSVACVLGCGCNGDNSGPGGSKRSRNGCNEETGACFMQKKPDTTQIIYENNKM
jgi:hypothetical protein